MTAYEETQQRLQAQPRVWLITGVAGFIGSHILQKLLLLGQRVVGLDNFSTGKRKNLDEVEQALPAGLWKNFIFLCGDITDPACCQRACRGVDFVLHQAALGSVEFSLENPARTNLVNVTGTLNILIAARDQKVKRVVYASSSSIYGDSPEMPKVESRPGRLISPYAASKRVNEIYAEAFTASFGLESIGLRYFNVFGERQDPQGAYAAVIPRWIAALIAGEQVLINGDGTTSRDFCYVANAVQANLLAAATSNPQAVNQVYNVALGGRTSLNELLDVLRDRLFLQNPKLARIAPKYRPFRPGDVLHSQADISLAREFLGYQPSHTLSQGLDQAISWYWRELKT